MGNYLLVPIKDKEVHKGDNAKLKFVSMGMQGWRCTQEDAHLQEIDIGGGMSLFAVMDGHGGNEVAEFVRDNLIEMLKANEHFSKGEYEAAFKETAKALDDKLKTPEGCEAVKKYVKPHYPATLMQTHKDKASEAVQTGCTLTCALIKDD